MDVNLSRRHGSTVEKGGAPVLHTANSEQAIEVVDLHGGMFCHETVHCLVVMHRVSGTDELICPSDVVDDFPIVGRTSEFRDVRVDGLRRELSGQGRGAQGNRSAYHSLSRIDTDVEIKKCDIIVCYSKSSGAARTCA